MEQLRPQSAEIFVDLARTWQVGQAFGRMGEVIGRSLEILPEVLAHIIRGTRKPGFFG